VAIDTGGIAVGAPTDRARRARPVAEPTQGGPPPRGLRTVLGAYLALTKPRIIELLLVTTVPPMVLAARGLPSGWLVLATLLGGCAAAASANTLNCYVDRDIDAVMDRTSRRPLVGHGPAGVTAISPPAALRFGIVLSVLATLELGLLVNWPAAALADAATLFYVFVYTLGLKRRTPQNIVIGGAAGCFPVLVGWAAVTGGVGWPALVLFGVVFLWTPPHFWALALRFKDDYAKAGVPMLPVVRPALSVVRQILVYSYLMVAATLALIPSAGWGYGAVALVLGAGFLVEGHRMLARTRAGADPRPMRLFHLSISYLTVLFAAVAIAPLV